MVTKTVLNNYLSLTVTFYWLQFVLKMAAIFMDTNTQTIMMRLHCCVDNVLIVKWCDKVLLQMVDVAADM